MSDERNLSVVLRDLETDLKSAEDTAKQLCRWIKKTRGDMIAIRDYVRKSSMKELEEIEQVMEID